MRGVAITGVGAITALGDLDRTFAALLEGRSGIDGPGPFPGKGPVAAIAGGPHLTSHLALAAARDALVDRPPGPLGVVGGSTSGDMVVGEREYEEWFRGGPTGPEFLWSQLCDRPAEVVARELGATGPRVTLSTACASGASAVGVAADWVRSGRCDAVLAFGADALCRLTVHGFGALQAVAAERCRPFDRARTGLSLGEGAGALLLEDEEAARRRGARILALVTGYGTAADAWHATAPHPEGRGARVAIRAAAGGLADRVGYVDAHGTGTRHNDEMEGAVLPEELPHAEVSSIKGAVGHTLGAAGAVELAVTVQALVHGVLPPNVGGTDPAIPVLTAPLRRPIEHAISVNFAFGGINAAVRVSAPTSAPPPGSPARPARASVRRVAWRLPRGLPTAPEPLAAALRSPGPPPEGGWYRTDDPERPEGVPPGDWRRATRLARLALEVVGELLAREPDLDRATLPVVYGSALGEVVPSSAFLDRLFGEGPRFASAFSFQNSVYNATPGHVGHLFGLQGPTETLSAGMATGLHALRRGVEWLERAPRALVLVADDLNRTTEAALGQGGGEAVVAALIEPGDAFELLDGASGGEAGRRRRLPYERRFAPLDRPVAPEDALGLCCANGLVAFLAGLDAVDQDDATALTGRWSR